ncbi:hypothetical protein B0H10DRAFT_125983 [Mycena sp. CBHHK59/15]|nr:hypothetical protein B0H10DRAFT_125983 [Mycena sp. CBHHK59/15]
MPNHAPSRTDPLGLSTTLPMTNSQTCLRWSTTPNSKTFATTTLSISPMRSVYSSPSPLSVRAPCPSARPACTTMLLAVNPACHTTLESDFCLAFSSRNCTESRQRNANP